MTDLNLWRLATADPDALSDADVAAGRALELGTHETGYPFTTQVKVGAVSVDTVDQAHPQSDGVVPGVDRARGFTVLMAGVSLGVTRPKRRRWTDRMDETGALAAVWEDPRPRSRAGRVAAVANVDRARVAYGRPRSFSSELELARHGWIPWTGEFVTMHPGWFGLVEHTETVALAPGAFGGFVIPISFPATTTTVSESPRAFIVNEGDARTWPRISVTGPIASPVIDLLSLGGGVFWSVRYDGALAYDETLEVDTRPWVRSVTVNGAPANGRLRGEPLAECFVRPGTSEARLTGFDATGTSRLNFRWRAGHAHL